MKEFITIEENNKIELVIKKSKFICDIIKVETIEEAEKNINQIRKKYYDAKHHCIAYRIMQENKVIERSNDDGEPSGTAGMPMLNILQKNNLCNVLVVVTRYFGGILLGTGGLSRAYSDVTLESIAESTKIKNILGIEIQIVLDYNNLEKFKYYCRKNDISIINISYADVIECKVEIEEDKNEQILEDFELKNINIIEYKILRKKYIYKSIWKQYFYIKNYQILEI